MEDSGALPIEMDVSKLKMGDVIEVYPYEGVTKAHGTGETLCTFSLKTDVLFDEARQACPCDEDARQPPASPNPASPAGPRCAARCGRAAASLS